MNAGGYHGKTMTVSNVMTTTRSSVSSEHKMSEHV